MPAGSPPSQGDRTTSVPEPTAHDTPGESADISPDTDSVDAEPPEEPDKTIEEKMLEMLIKIHEKMEGPQVEGGAGRPSGIHAQRGPFRQAYFGIPRQHFNPGQQLNLGNEDYEETFPEDSHGEEVGPNARVFRMYNEEATLYDNDMIGKSGESADVLLVFAGLFSAILSTFVAQTSQALETDNDVISNSLLLEIVQLQRAQENGSPFSAVERAITETTPTSNDKWVNGLWFTSLTLSLATALFAVLTKQWLRQYMVSTFGTRRDRSLIRQFRFAGMEKWHVVGIIGLLPIVLHLALSVFLAGLVIFLIPRCLPLAYVIGAMTVVVYSLYFITNLLPVIDIHCPYRTPFSEILNVLCYHIQIALLLPRTLFYTTMNALGTCLHQMAPGIHSGNIVTLEEFPAFRSLRHKENEHVQRDSLTASLSLDVIAWLLKTSSNPSVHSIAVQAVGGLAPSQRDKATRLFLTSSGRAVLPLLLSEYPIASPKIERLARVFPLFKLPSPKIYFHRIFAQFRDLNDITGMVSSLSCCPPADVSVEDFTTIVLLIHHSPNVKLSPCLWTNFFSHPHASKGSTEAFKHHVCTKAIPSYSLGLGSTWEDTMDPVPYEVAFSRYPKLILSAFADDDPLRGLEPLERLASPSPRLHALITLHNFLHKVSEPILSLRSLWTSIIDIGTKEAAPTIEDCSAVFHAADHCLAESPLLKRRERISQDLIDYYRHVLASCQDVSVYANDKFGLQFVRSWKWKCLDRIASVALGKEGSQLSSLGYSLWRHALEWDVEHAYISFVNNHVLDHGHDSEHVVLLLKSFVSGLARQRKRFAWHFHRSPNSYWTLGCLKYLHLPSNLMSAWNLLTMHKDSTPDDFLALARLDPDNDIWDFWRTLLLELDDIWYPEEAREAHVKFFENRHRRKKFICPVNALVALLSPGFRRYIVPQAPDIERPQSIPGGSGENPGSQLSHGSRRESRATPSPRDESIHSGGTTSSFVWSRPQSDLVGEDRADVEEIETEAVQQGSAFNSDGRESGLGAGDISVVELTTRGAEDATEFV